MEMIMAQKKVTITIDPELHQKAIQKAREIAVNEKRGMDFSKLVSELLVKFIYKK
jgi:hypothetical protein